LATIIYAITQNFPNDELYGLTSQMRRAVVSISSNIAEGRTRGVKLEFIHFLNIAHGSCAELESQICIAEKLPFGKKIDFKGSINRTDEIMRMLGVIISRLRNPKLKS
jgi:four helix bundle protein